ncbi:copper homeostasis protein CutC [Nocardiopsis trehalosi]|uniref:copper homeostasis protein CutC n=1 Tax=Nocardiopsis trehalosi TaxID=109329 RepID=UPI000B1F25A7|nr:copper homeostasis protein CutC [Nocardiopsis trehalosi]
MEFEVVVEGAAGALVAERAGAARVELVAALVDGGLTPSLGTVAAVLGALSATRVFPIVRPRGGDFVYDRYEAAAMEHDVRAFAAAGVHGVVVGALTPEGAVDRPLVRRLVAAAGGLPVTFHRAFDVAADPRAALEDLAGLGVARVLTSGQEAAAIDGAPLIADLVRRSAGRVAVMAGGGVRAEDAADLVAATGVEELHFSGMAAVPGPAVHRNPRVRMGGTAVPPEDERRVNDPVRIAAIMAAGRAGAARRARP